VLEERQESGGGKERERGFIFGGSERAAQRERGKEGGREGAGRGGRGGTRDKGRGRVRKRESESESETEQKGGRERKRETGISKSAFHCVCVCVRVCVCACVFVHIQCTLYTHTHIHILMYRHAGKHKEKIIQGKFYRDMPHSYMCDTCTKGACPCHNALTRILVCDLKHYACDSEAYHTSRLGHTHAQVSVRFTDTITHLTITLCTAL